MPISGTCPHCRSSFQLSERLRGKRVRCASCQEPFIGPTAADLPNVSPKALSPWLTASLIGGGGLVVLIFVVGVVQWPVGGARSWSEFDTSQATVQGDHLHLPAGNKAILSLSEYSGPMEITLVARTTRNNIRIRAYKTAGVILNWEVNPSQFRLHHPDGRGGDESGSVASASMTPLCPNQWYTIRWRITTDRITVTVNDQVIYQGAGRYDLSVKDRVRVHTVDSDVDVKSFFVDAL